MTAQGLDPFLKDVIQVLSWITAIVAGIVAAFKALHEMRETRKLRVQELRWKKAHLGREVLVKFMEKGHVRDALKMLDWSGREYEVMPGQKVRINSDDMLGALRPHTAADHFTAMEAYVRDCFDALFEGLEIFEHYLRTDLLDFRDIEFPLDYYVCKLADRREVMVKFMRAYSYELAVAFLGRFPVYAKSPDGAG